MRLAAMCSVACTPGATGSSRPHPGSCRWSSTVRWMRRRLPDSSRGSCRASPLGKAASRRCTYTLNDRRRHRPGLSLGTWNPTRQGERQLANWSRATALTAGWMSTRPSWRRASPYALPGRSPVRPWPRCDATPLHSTVQTGRPKVGATLREGPRLRSLQDRPSSPWCRSGRRRTRVRRFGSQRAGWTSSSLASHLIHAWSGRSSPSARFSRACERAIRPAWLLHRPHPPRPLPRRGGSGGTFAAGQSSLAPGSPPRSRCARWQMRPLTCRWTGPACVWTVAPPGAAQSPTGSRSGTLPWNAASGVSCSLRRSWTCSPCDGNCRTSGCRDGSPRQPSGSDRWTVSCRDTSATPHASLRMSRYRQ